MSPWPEVLLGDSLPSQKQDHWSLALISPILWSQNSPSCTHWCFYSCFYILYLSLSLMSRLSFFCSRVKAGCQNPLGWPRAYLEFLLLLQPDTIARLPSPIRADSFFLFFSSVSRGPVFRLWNEETQKTHWGCRTLLGRLPRPHTQLNFLT